MHQAVRLDPEHRHQGDAIEEVLRVGGHNAAGVAGGFLFYGGGLLGGGLSVGDLGWHEYLLAGSI